MGECNRCIQHFNMNKFAVVVCLAVVKAEADADAYYGAYGYGLGLGYAGYAGYAAAPYAYAAPYAAGYGVTNAANSVGIAGLAPAAAPAVVGGYAAAGRYVCQLCWSRPRRQEV